MIKIGITGQSGFVGTHLFNTLGLFPDKYERISFDDAFFSHEKKLNHFVQNCDTIVHLAAMNRHNDEQVIYDTNMGLVKKLIMALEETNCKPHIIFASSTQEEKENLYGKSKREGRILFQNWANNNGGLFTGLIIPNVFGPFGNPYYNSFIATFSHQLTHNEIPSIEVDGEVKLIYVAELVEEIINCIKQKKTASEYRISHTYEKKVSEILNLLTKCKNEYFENGNLPTLTNRFELNLFNTFRCYISHANFFPFTLKVNEDSRGTFVEILKTGVGGQVSFSTTKPGITRGNHYHTRKIERFAVIQGEASIELRKIGNDETLSFYLSGKNPSFVDIPIWFTHNISNIGKTELLTIFWINEFYNPNDPDTFFEEV
jgi:UDP-2-acetamido-2,6-beta-L-arabino-hexul-4-ose reductase